MPKPSSNAPAASAAPPPSALERAALVAADRLLYLAHLAAMAFIVFGWMLPATRMANWYLIVLTFVSWFGLGLVFGFGFCLITGIQSKIRQRLGYSEPMDSFVKHVLDRLTGRDLNPLHVEIGTQAGFYIAAVASAWVNFGHRWL
jgi:Protein of Unknown function (DUF2784)